jgi:hypothetical protein
MYGLYAGLFYVGYALINRLSILRSVPFRYNHCYRGARVVHVVLFAYVFFLRLRLRLFVRFCK